jgi:hypothetical protein
MLGKFTTTGTSIRETFNPQTVVASDIYIINTDGSNATKLTDGIGINSDPLVVKTGAGDRILFNSNPDSMNIFSAAGFDLYSIATDGSGLKRLTNNTLYDGTSGWCYSNCYSPGSVSHLANVQVHYQGLPFQGHHPIHKLRW